MPEKTKKKKSVTEADFKSALIKKALGYDATEVVEEYVSGDEGEIKLTKKKVTKKNVPPDITAIKLLLGEDNLSVEEMSDEELEKEKERLIKLLKNYE
jgi:hypothetical protein